VDREQAGGFRAVIDRVYPLEQVVDATRYVETEHKTGNVVLAVGRDHPPSAGAS
jgi:NADPH:quinone reductase-like Zn-dependent oxidoreductase